MAFQRFHAKPSSTVSSSTPLPLLILNWFLRFFQFVLAITVCGLYGVDLNSKYKESQYVTSKWGYAVAVGALSAFTALVYVVPKLKSYYAFGWDVMLFILWTAVFGIFGSIYIKEDAHGDSSVMRMKNAVWVDLANMLLWFITAIMSLVLFFMRGGRSMFTGRAAV